MHPLLFRLGPLPFYSFGLLFALGFLLGVFYVFKVSRNDIVLIRANVLEERILNIVLLTSLFGLLGARTFYIISHPLEFGFDPLKLLLFTYFPGLTLTGGVVGALSFLIIFTKIHKFPLLTMLDIATFGFLLGAPFGFLGSFLGEKVSQFPIHLVEAFIMLFLFWAFLFLKSSRIIQKDGVLALTFCLIFAIVSFAFDFARIDRVFLLFLSFNQWLSLVLGIGALTTFIIIKKQEIAMFLRKYNLLW